MQQNKIIKWFTVKDEKGLQRAERFKAKHENAGAEVRTSASFPGTQVQIVVEY